jgi:hypothetical protein
MGGGGVCFCLGPWGGGVGHHWFFGSPGSRVEEYFHILPLGSEKALEFLDLLDYRSQDQVSMVKYYKFIIMLIRP